MATRTIFSTDSISSRSGGEGSWGSGAWQSMGSTGSGSLQLIVTGLGSNQYNLLESIVVHANKDREGNWIALPLGPAGTVGLYGVGESEVDAVNDFVLMMVEMYEDLIADEKILGKGLQKHLVALRGIMDGAHGN